MTTTRPTLGYLDGVLTVFGLEFRQRLRTRGWYVLLVVWFALICGVTALGQAADNSADMAGQFLFELVVGFVLLFALLVVPAMSANSVSGDRASGTLAILQSTLLRPGQLLWGKWLAAWAASLVFLAVAVPALVWAVLSGGVHVASLPVFILMVALELGLMCAIGIGISARSHRPLFAVTATYLLVAAFTVGTPIAFGLGSALTREEIQAPAVVGWEPDGENGNGHYRCSETRTTSWTLLHTERTAWMLAANPFVIVSDAVPKGPDTSQDFGIMGSISSSVRDAQRGGDEDIPCLTDRNAPTAPTTARPGPIWPLGVGIQAAVAAAALVAGHRRLRTPIGRLPAGMRVA
ncbi:ABC transporter permease subunit [Prescottella defluvii]|uniref:ABC transporter permease n=1 Tax=Prescottella defluvii TaxID=1323361 RepID=UPI0004F29F01|nr:ABC transporter permease subunit [Prescottella defluvii]